MDLKCVDFEKSTVAVSPVLRSAMLNDGLIKILTVQRDWLFVGSDISVHAVI